MFSIARNLKAPFRSDQQLSRHVLGLVSVWVRDAVGSPRRTEVISNLQEAEHGGRAKAETADTADSDHRHARRQWERFV